MCLFDADGRALDLSTNPYQEGGSDEDTTKDKDHEALEGPMTRGRLKQAQNVTRLVICIATIVMIEGPSGER